MKIGHRRFALGWMKLQALFTQHPFPPGGGIVVIDDLQSFERGSALFGKPIVDLYELPAGMRQAVGHDRPQLLRHVPRQRIAHLDGSIEFCAASNEHLHKGLAGVPMGTEE